MSGERGGERIQRRAERRKGRRAETEESGAEKGEANGYRGERSGERGGERIQRRRGAGGRGGGPSGGALRRLAAENRSGFRIPCGNGDRAACWRYGARGNAVETLAVCDSHLMIAAVQTGAVNGFAAGYGERRCVCSARTGFWGLADRSKTLDKQFHSLSSPVPFIAHDGFWGSGASDRADAFDSKGRISCGKKRISG